MEEPNPGWLAVVAYVPHPLSEFLMELRALLPGDAQPDPHVTILPPRPLSLSLNSAKPLIQQALRPVEPFAVELGPITVFPETKRLYLPVQNGREDVQRVHDLLNHGALAAPEPFEYVPHLTLCDPLAREQVKSTIEEAQKKINSSALHLSFDVIEMVLLWKPQYCANRDWSRVCTLPLATAPKGHTILDR